MAAEPDWTSEEEWEATQARVAEEGPWGEDAEFYPDPEDDCCRPADLDDASLRENRRGLERLLAQAAAGKFDVVRVTHKDLLARFGARWLVALLARDDIEVRVLHSKGSVGGMEELLADFMSLVASFAGRMYGIRGRTAKARLLSAATERIEDPKGEDADVPAS
jgi:hypothetical protein